MGLATSQVRLLALTSRKADVEMQIQLNSKRKTMLMRESTELSKLYYAKLQDSKIRYATSNGYKDVSYDYLMSTSSPDYFENVVNGEASDDIKASSSMILTDTYGRVILSNNLLDVVINTLNESLKTTKTETTEELTLSSMKYLLQQYASTEQADNGTGTKPMSSGTAAVMLEQFNALYDGSIFAGADYNAGALSTEAKKEDGRQVLLALLNNGYNNAREVYYKDGNFYSTSNKAKWNDETKITLEVGKFYIVKDENYRVLTDADGSMYLPNASSNTNNKIAGFVNGLSGTVAQQIARMMTFYGSMLSAAFNGQGTTVTADGSAGTTISNYNATAKLTSYTNDSGELQYAFDSNDTYYNVTNADKLQAGLKSGLYQLVSVTSPATGGIAKNQDLEYFKTQNLIVEQTDNSVRETITAWYNAAKADLEEKETYWDTEISSLSTELSTITTEIESVKKLREDAISSTFKWGSA